MEQFRASSTLLTGIGSLWAAALQDFVQRGGTVIQCDYGQKYQILSGAGLMDIRGSTNRSGFSALIVDPNNPLVKAFTSTNYTATSYCSHYNTPEPDVVVNRPGYGPVVINRRLGLGHVVLIGHDYYASNSDQDRLLGNAVFFLPAQRSALSDCGAS